MNQQLLLELLDNYCPYDSAEKESLKATREFIKNSKEFWQRKNIIGHITVSTWVVASDFKHILLAHHRKFDKWLQVGGHIESCDENIVSAAKRELFEETGIREYTILSDGIYDVDVHLIPTNGDETAHNHYDIRLAIIAPININLIQNSEIKDIKWIPVNDVKKFDINNSTVRMVKKTSSLSDRTSYS